MAAWLEHQGYTDKHLKKCKGSMNINYYELFFIGNLLNMSKKIKTCLKLLANKPIYFYEV